MTYQTYTQTFDRILAALAKQAMTVRELRELLYPEFTTSQVKHALLAMHHQGLASPVDSGIFCRRQMTRLPTPWRAVASSKTSAPEPRRVPVGQIKRALDARAHCALHQGLFGGL